MSKEKVEQALIFHTRELDALVAAETLTTEGISDEVGIQRNTTSQYLNELVKSGQAIKVKSRPAYFYSTAVVTENFFEPKQQIYDSFDQINEYLKQSQFANTPDAFADLIGSQSSLKLAIDQIKSSVYYPGTGLPFMLYGETGVGKSHLARITHKYCIDKGILNEDAPFIELNCAQYYHNQELLSSILFGYRKGAFTGADSDHVGLLEAADGGILFLDECHRLNPESQEKLFTYIDTHTFQRVGDNNRNRQSNVRLIFATTEDIQTNFLRTFIRRVPITINIPNLHNRGKQERAEYIYTFLIRESKKLGKSLVLSPWIINRLLSFTYRDNVGEMKNICQLICAAAYSKHASEDPIMVNSESLNNFLLAKFLEVQEIDSIETKNVTITPDADLSFFVNQISAENRLASGIFKVFENLFEDYLAKKIDKHFLIQQLAREANTFIDLLINNESEEKNNSLKLLVSSIKELVNFLEVNQFVKVNGNSIVALANYLYRRVDFSIKFPYMSALQISSFETFISKNLFMEQKVLQALLELIETKLDLTLAAEEKILLTFYFKGLNLTVQQPEMRGVILAHGFSTASSIADVVNHFLDSHLFDAFDMPFNMPLERVEESMRRYMATNDCSKGLVVLADMGSLMVLSEKLKNELTGPMLIIDNVTTQQALFVGEMLQKKTDLEELARKITENMKMSYQLSYPKIIDKPMILTVCHTGLGAARQLKEFLESSLPDSIEYKVEAVDYNYLKKYGRESSVFKQYSVKGIIGTSDPDVQGVNYVALEDLISGTGQEKIDEIFAFIEDPDVRKEINNNMVRNLSIERLVSAITILDVKRVIHFIDNMIDFVERRFRIELTNSKKAILYVHIAGLVERSIRNIEEVTYPNEAVSTERANQLLIIGQALAEIETAYNIKISTHEMNYLYDIIFDV